MIGDWLFAIGLFVGGYVASIFTWPWLRKKALGAEGEIERLRLRIAKIVRAARE
jgi:hypothetical protein